MISKCLFAIIIFLHLTSIINAQKKKTFRVNPGEMVVNTIPAENMYEYREFTMGNVLFKNGRLGSAKLNYNSLLGEMEFLGDKHDTLALDDLGSMHYVSIANDTFYYNKIFLKQLSNSNGIKLAVNRAIVLTNREKIGGFGEVNGGSVEVKEQVSANASMLKSLVAQQILTFSENYTYYFGDKFSQFKPASRKNVMEMFGKLKPGLEKYLDTYKPNYFDKQDVDKLAAFLQQSN